MMIFLLLLSSIAALPANAYAQSQAFGNREILDDTLDHIRFEVGSNEKQVGGGLPAMDISAVNYFSDGKVLNATIWTADELVDPSDYPRQYQTMEYGMYIDADFDANTGFRGIDYQLEVEWSNETGTWTKLLEKWSYHGKQKVIENVTNYAGFFNEGQSYVELSLNLEALQSPEQYKIRFYTETERGSERVIDLVDDHVTIPPPVVELSTVPSELVMRPGETSTIELKLNATQGYDLDVGLAVVDAKESPDSLEVCFVSSNKTLQLHVPLHGEVTTPLTVAVPENAEARPYTLFVNATSKPTMELLPVERLGASESWEITSARLPTEASPVNSTMSLSVTVEEQPPPVEAFMEGLNRWSAGLTFVYGVMAGITPWLINRIKKRLVVARKETTTDNDDNNNRSSG